METNKSLWDMNAPFTWLYPPFARMRCKTPQAAHCGARHRAL